MKQYPNIERLEQVMKQLRDKKKGCPWDCEQDFKSLTHYTIEEVYELIEAIDDQNRPAIQKELGDLFFHLIFYARLAEEKNWFDLDDIAKASADKMINRHPHVFAEKKYDSIRELKEAWHEQKSKEEKSQSKSLMDNISTALPAFIRARKLQSQAARVGFDWDKAEQVVDKISEETNELKAVILQNQGQDKLQEELGDMLFSMINLARHLDIDPETALRHSANKFAHRFTKLEEVFDYDSKKMKDASIEELEKNWQKIK